MDERDRAFQESEAYAVMGDDPVWGWVMGLVFATVPPGFILAWVTWPSLIQ